jgi:hypothetical protein
MLQAIRRQVFNARYNLRTRITALAMISSVAQGACLQGVEPPASGGGLATPN